MEVLTLATITGIGGLMLGLVVGTILGWRRTLEIIDEVGELKAENSRLKAEAKDKTKVIEIKDERVDITHDYYQPF